MRRSELLTFELSAQFISLTSQNVLDMKRNDSTSCDLNFLSSSPLGGEEEKSCHVLLSTRLKTLPSEHGSDLRRAAEHATTGIVGCSCHKADGFSYFPERKSQITVKSLKALPSPERFLRVNMAIC